MASDETTLKTVHLVYDDDEDDDEVCCAAASGLSRLSRLSIETSDGEDADAEMSADDDDERPITATKNNNGEFFISEGTVSLPGTPDRAGSGPWAKDYASETEARGRGRRRRRRRARERWLDRAWEMKRSSGPEQCRVLVRPRGPDSGSICMDMDEVKACRELGLELPCDWTMEIPGGFSGVDTSSGGNSPIGDWRISSPGDNPGDVKARLKVWARAVALASASSLSG